MFVWKLLKQTVERMFVRGCFAGTDVMFFQKLSWEKASDVLLEWMLERIGDV